MCKPLLLSLLLLSISSSAFSEHVYKVYTEEFPPYNYIKNGQLIGENVDMVNRVFKQLNVTPEFIVLPWARTYLHALTTPNTLIFSMARNEEREKLFKWVGALEGIESCLYSLTGRNDIQLSNLEEAKAFKVVTQLNGHINVILEQNGFTSGKDLFLSVSIGSAMKMLEMGRADLIGLPKKVMAFHLLKQGKETDATIEQKICFKETALYLAFNIDTPDEIVKEFSKALNKVKKQ